MSKIFHPRESRTIRLDIGRNSRVSSIDERRNLGTIYEDELGEMAQQDIDTIYKSLRLLPEFDGNPHVLTRFINLCDQLVLTHFKEGQHLSNQALLNGILNRVTGPAARLINSNGIPENWVGIKSVLINNFADQRDETALYSELALLSQGPNTPQEYYEKCQGIFSTIMTYVTLHETIATTITAKRDLYQKLTLQAYLRGLRDPLGYKIRCMRPVSMEQALQFVQEELNTVYMQQLNEGGKKDWQRHPLQGRINLPLSNFQPKPMSFGVPAPQAAFNMPGPSRPYPMQPQPFQVGRPNFTPQMQPPRGPSRTQQIMRAPPQNYNPQSNVFRMPNRAPQFQPQNQPRPMSGVSHFVPRTLPQTQTLGRQDWSNFRNPPPSNYFKTREVNFNEFGYDYNDYSNDYEYASYDQNYYPYEYSDYPCYEEQVPYQEPAVIEEVGDQLSAPTEGVNFQNESQSEKPK